jgi:polyhydroxybutyrate depolymerase
MTRNGHKTCLLLMVTLIIGGMGQAAGQNGEIPGRWGTNDTSRPENIEWPATWVGARNLRAQWFKILAESPEDWKASGYLNHAKGEPPDNTNYLWRYDQPLPEGTKILIEGDFPQARMLSFQVTAPWNNKMLVSSDGVGLPEIHLLDQDIVPDPGHTNPFLPGSDRKAKKRHFHITFELRDGDPVLLNPQAAVPPYRAPGNLRIGGTATVEPGKLFGSPKSRGPAVYVRIYLPDRYDPYGGVEPPVIRLQLPGKKPELAPISRGMPINLRKFVDNYSLQDNPALTEGRSVKELEALEQLRLYAKKAVNQCGRPGEALPDTRRMLRATDGTLQLYKVFQTPWLITYFRDYLFKGDLEGAKTQLPRRYYAAFGAMGPSAPPPGNDEHVSDHHIFNTYLAGSAGLGPDQLLVIHGKAPRTPRTLKGTGIMEPSDQLRYWNISMHSGQPTKLTAVVNITDEQVVTNESGYYSIVVGPERLRPAEAVPANSITWHTWPAGANLGINMRILSTAEKIWEHAPQLITWQEADFSILNRNPTAVRQRMGEYFPEARYLTPKQVQALGEGISWEKVIGLEQKARVPSAAAKEQEKRSDPGGHDQTLMVDDRRRSYRVHLPVGYENAQRLPLVIVLHGGRMNGVQMENLTGLSLLADQNNFIACYPDAFGKIKDQAYWNDGRLPEVDDVKFISVLIDELVSRFKADPSRVYLTGFSNGAGMANRLGIQLAEKVAAIAPVAGTLPRNMPDTWKSKLPMPVLYFHGTDDPFAYFSGGSAGTHRESSLSAEQYVRWWAKKNGYAEGFKPEVSTEKGPDGLSVKRVWYGSGRDEVEVIFYAIEGGGHTWPGRMGFLPEKIYGKTASGTSANTLMWDFFSKYRRDTRKSPAF